MYQLIIDQTHPAGTLEATHDRDMLAPAPTVMITGRYVHPEFGIEAISLHDTVGATVPCSTEITGGEFAIGVPERAVHQAMISALLSNGRTINLARLRLQGSEEI